VDGTTVVIPDVAQAVLLNLFIFIFLFLYQCGSVDGTTVVIGALKSSLFYFIISGLEQQMRQ
jgi:hypothetical protein